MTEQQRIRETRRGQRRRQIEEQSLLVTDWSQEEQRRTPDPTDAVFAALVTEVAGEHQPHQVISNKRLWDENIQEVGE
jgi:hypothetical protein